MTMSRASGRPSRSGSSPSSPHFGAIQTHLIESADEVGFGITTYGYAPYPSYLHPGGMNFVR
jgi:hypothetical protein